MNSKKEIKKKNLKNYQLNKGELGIYDLRNRLNDLTGKQWTFSTRSVITKQFSNNYPKNWFFKYPGILPLQVIYNLFQTFTKNNASIYDPYAILGNSLLVKLKLGLKQKFQYSNLQQEKIIDLFRENNFNNSKEILGCNSEFLPDQSADLLFSQAIIDLEENLVVKEENLSKKYKKVLDFFFSNVNVLKTGKYAVLSISNWIIKDIPNHSEFYFDTNTEIISKLKKSELVPKGEIIWSQPQISISGLNDTRIWVFRKEI